MNEIQGDVYKGVIRWRTLHAHIHTTMDGCDEYRQNVQSRFARKSIKPL